MRPGEVVTSRRRGAAGAWRPTIAFVRAAVVAVVLIGIALISRRPDLLVLATPFAIVTAWSASTRPGATPDLEDRIGNPTLREGDATTWRAWVSGLDHVDHVNARIDPLPWLETRPDSGAVDVAVEGEQAEFEMTLRSTRWGRRILEPVHLVAASPWAAFQCSMTTAHTSLTTLPVPAVFDTGATVRPSEGLVGTYRSTRRGEGSEFANIRAFSTGDRIRRINWPRSLRSDDLQVNATWADQDTHVNLVVDAADDYGRSDGVDGAASSLDTTVRAAGAIAEYYGRRGDRISLRAFGTLALHVVPAASGPTQVRRVLDTLSRIRPSGASPSSRHDRGARCLAGQRGRTDRDAVATHLPRGTRSGGFAGPTRAPRRRRRHPPALGGHRRRPLRRHRLANPPARPTTRDPTGPAGRDPRRPVARPRQPRPIPPRRRASCLRSTNAIGMT